MPGQPLDSSDECATKRGEATRSALIGAGIQLFGEYGLKGTTTRMLAKHSGANLSAIPYYFGSKEGLYKVVVEYIVERMHALTQDKFDITGVASNLESLSRRDARAMVKHLMCSILTIFLESDEPNNWSQIIVREQANPTDAFDILYEGQMKPMHSVMLQLVSLSVGISPESDEVKIRAHTLIGQLLSFVVSRETLLRQLGVKQITEAHFPLINDVVAAHVEACLQVPAVSRSANT